MDVLDEEVFAVIVAIAVVASVIGIAQVLRPEVVEPFTAIGLLNSECVIGEYPKDVFEGEELKLCLFLYNHLGRPQLMMVKYKFGSSELLPTNTSPSPAEAIKSFEFLLSHGGNITRVISVPIPTNSGFVGGNATLIFELWLYDLNTRDWVYSGRWVHLHVNVRGSPVP